MEVASSAISEESALASLPEAIRDCFRERLGRPTTIQRMAWPTIAAGTNILLAAPTGTGKTLGAFLPLIGSILESPPTASVRVLYLSPLKALAADVRRNLRAFLAALAAHLPAGTALPRLALRTGDSSPRDRKQLWLEPPEILLTTPESLSLLLTYPAARVLFGGLRAVVVDEVHALAVNKRGADLCLSLERLELLSGVFQRIGLSATSTPLEETGRFLVGMERPCVLASVADDAPLEIRIQPLPAGPTFLSRLLDLVGPELEANRSTLLFANTRALAERLSWALRRRHPGWSDRIAVHHSSLSPERRRRVERQLKRGLLRAVVSSTSLELGIDIGTVDLVILVHPPGDVIRLLQRTGRAGHSPGQARRGLLLTSGPGELLEAVVTAASGRARECEPLQVPDAPLDVLCQQLLGLATMGSWSQEAAMRVCRRAYPFHRLTEQDLSACLDYLSGGHRRLESERWLPPRLLWEGDEFRLLDDRTLRLLRRNLGTILAEESCEVILDEEMGEGTAGERDSEATPLELIRPRLIGQVDELFAEGLAPGDRFLLDGLCLEFRRLERPPGRREALRLVARETPGRPRIPRWAGDGLPMSPELAQRLFRFRSRAAEALRESLSHFTALLGNDYNLETEAKADLVSLFQSQESISEVPDDSVLLVEIVPSQSLSVYYLHTPLNRGGNDALARVLAVRFARLAVGVPPLICLAADLGLALYVRGVELTPEDFRRLHASDSFEEDLHRSLEESLALRERFQRVALTGLMMLRHPVGGRRKVGGRDWAERRLFDQVKARHPEFPLLAQARRELQKQTCDAAAARNFLDCLPACTLRCRVLSRPSPLVESWTQAEPTVAEAPRPLDEVLRLLHRSLTGERAS